MRSFWAGIFLPAALFLLAHLFQQGLELAFQFMSKIDREGAVAVAQDAVRRADSPRSFYQQAVRRQLEKMAVMRQPWGAAAFHFDGNNQAIFFNQVVGPAGDP